MSEAEKIAARKAEIAAAMGPTYDEIEEIKRRAQATLSTARGWERAYADDVTKLIREIEWLRETLDREACASAEARAEVRELGGET